MLINKAEAEKVSNSNNCKVREYNISSETVSFATAKIDGRYPDEDRVVNMQCEELYYVISGSGVIHSEFGDFGINPGGLYYFKKAEKYWVEGNDMHMAIISTPKWSKEQHKKVK